MTQEEWSKYGKPGLTVFVANMGSNTYKRLKVVMEMPRGATCKREYDKDKKTSASMGGEWEWHPYQSMLLTLPEGAREGKPHSGGPGRGSKK